MVIKPRLSGGNGVLVQLLGFLKFQKINIQRYCWLMLISRRFNKQSRPVLFVQKQKLQYLIIYCSILLFFAVYVIYKKNYSFSRVVFLFFFQAKIANSFYSKINYSGRLGTTRFSSSRFAVRVTAPPKFFTIYP